MIEKKIALVTGASRGIGLEIARELIKEGISVIGTSRDKQTIDEIAAEETTNSAIMYPMQLDISNPISLENDLKVLGDSLPIPNILVNNAALVRDNLLMKMSLDDWDVVIASNLSSVYVLSKYLIRGMMKSRFGRIVNISSVVGLSGNPGQSNYSAAKSGLFGFTKSLALEVASRGITVNCIAPGFITTSMTDKLSAEQKEAILSKIPMKTMGKTSDIAGLVAFLVSERGRYITGETINVNGGMLMT